MFGNISYLMSCAEMLEMGVVVGQGGRDLGGKSKAAIVLEQNGVASTIDEISKTFASCCGVFCLKTPSGPLGTNVCGSKIGFRQDMQ
jgi:hypothetical protein